MKRLLIIHHSGIIGGAGVSLLHIIKSIDKQKYKVIVLCPDNPCEMIEILKNEDCEVIPLRNSPKIFNHYNGGIEHALSIKTLKNIIEILKDYRVMESYIKNTKPDIVIINSMTLFWLGRIIKKLNLKSICFHRETYQKGLIGLRSKIIKLGLSKWFDKVVFISKNDLKETGKISAITEVIYDRVEVSSFTSISKDEAIKKLNLDTNYKYVLYLGGMSKLKGAHIIMKAMKYVNESAKLIFINDTDSLIHPRFKDYKNIKDKIRLLLKKDIKYVVYKIYQKDNLKEKVIFKERTKNPEVYYKACDLVVFPSTKPHQSRPIYEAGISKIPILITDFIETSEFAKNGITAITFKNKDYIELANKINKIILGEIDTTEIVKQNYLQSIKNHDFATLKNDLERILDNM